MIYKAIKVKLIMKRGSKEGVRVVEFYGAPLAL